MREGFGPRLDTLEPKDAPFLAIITGLLLAFTKMPYEQAFVHAESILIDARRMIAKGGVPPKGQPEI